MGKRDKEHRKKVQARNARLKIEEKRKAKIFEKFMQEQLQAFRDSESGLTENVESIEVEATEMKKDNTITIDMNGPIQSSETV